MFCTLFGIRICLIFVTAKEISSNIFNNYPAHPIVMILIYLFAMAFSFPITFFKKLTKDKKIDIFYFPTYVSTSYNIIPGFQLAVDCKCFEGILISQKKGDGD